MQKKIFYHLLIFIGFLAVVGGCNPSRVTISKTNFDKQVATQQNLLFSFNQAIVADSVVNKQNWDTTRYLDFKPKVAGKFKWVANNQLVFSPQEGFAPSTNYTAQLRKAIAKNVDEKAVINFHTPYLDIESTDAFWAHDGRGNVQVCIKLNFNYSVNAKNVQQLVRFSSNNEKISQFKLVNDGIGRSIMFSIEEDNNKKLDEQELSINIEKGLNCAESNYQTQEVLVQKIKLPHKNRLAILEATAEVLENRTQILIKTNQTIAPQVLQNAITVSPKIAIETEALEYGFLIKGDFQLGNTYQINIKKGLQGVLGGTLNDDYTQSISFDSQQPAISFASKKGLYLTNKGNKNIAINIANVPKVEIEVYKIYENNLLNFLKERGSEYYFDDNRGSYYNEYEEYGDKIYNKAIETKSLTGNKFAKVLHIDFDNIDKRFNKGIYIVSVSSTENQYTNSRRMVAISDIGLIAKKVDNEVFVAVNSIMTAKPLANVQIRLISKSNQVIDKVETNADGIAVFKDVKAKYNGEIPMITAVLGEDFNYLHTQQTTIDKSSFEVGGLVEKTAGQAFIYAERTLYRPGETVNYNILVRDKRWRTQANVPIKVKIISPTGKEISAFKATTDAQGAYLGTFKTAQNSMTGAYTLDVFSGADQLLESLSIQVEEFMPDRIKAKLSLVEANYKDELTKDIKQGDSARIKLEAVNLFGPPAADRNYQMNFSLEKITLKPKNYKDYNFYVRANSQQSDDYQENESYNTVIKRTEKEGKTNEKGLAFESFYVPIELTNTGLLSGKVSTTVFDETGRSINRYKTFNVFTQQVFLGIQNFDNYVSTNQALKIGIVALNTQETPISTSIRIQILRNRWQTILEKSKYGSGMEYVSRKISTVVQVQDFNLSAGANTYSFMPDRSGDYEIRLYLPESDSYVSSNFYAYSFGLTDNNAFEINKDGKIDIKFDKPNYKVGENANVLFTTPFEGRMLVSIERNKVFEYKFIDTKQKTASYSFGITEDYLPNVYVTATLIKPISDGAIPLTVAHGFEPIFVEKPSTKLDLSIEAIEKTESKQKQTIKVKANRAENDIQVTIAVVDEGILQIKNYNTPNPHQHFYQKRALEVTAIDLYPRLFPEIGLGKSSVGGDGGDFNSRAGQMINKRVKLVSFWSGILKTNAAGEVYYTIDIPQFSGSLRIMAVAYKNDAFGSAQKNMTVADPLVISAGVPRFVSPKDKIIIPTTLTNTTEVNQITNVEIQTTPNLQIVGERRKDVTIRKNAESQTQFEIVAQNVMDSAKITIIATNLANNRRFTEVIDLNIRPITGLLKQAGSGEITAGNTTQFNFKQGWIPNYTKARLLVSNSPLVEFASQLDYLLAYPHGCAEQITSTVFPQLYVKDLMQHFKKGNKNTDIIIKENVQEALMMLAARQNYSGGFSYWAGDNEVNWWTSTYVTHFMLEAQKAGYEVNTQVIERALNYLQNQVREHQTENYVYYDERGRRRERTIANKSALYALYVMTLGKRKDLASLNYYKENSTQLALDSKYLLASCYKILGDNQKYNAILPTAFEGERSQNALGGNFYSYLRDAALVLNTMIETEPNHPQIPTLARLLAQQMRNARYLNTQESSFALLALGKLSKKYQNNQITASVKANGIEIAQFKGQDIKIETNLVGKDITISTQGTGNLYYSWQTEGLSATGEFEPTDRFLKVRKTFFDKDGNEIKNKTFKQNDLVVVRLSINADPSAIVDNVVMTDMLPAGFEIENPRLTTTAVPWLEIENDYSLFENSEKKNPNSKSQRAYQPDYLDVRDDRINFYVKAAGNRKDYFYMARAVSKGTFQMGPVSADAMYNGEYYSYNGADVIRIIDKYDNNN